MAFTKAKIVMAGLAVTAVCIVAPQQLKAQVPEAQMDGVMGQSIEDETVYESKPDLDTLIEKNAHRRYRMNFLPLPLPFSLEIMP